MTEKFMTREEVIHHNSWIIQDQFNMVRIGILLGRDNHDLNLSIFKGLSGEQSVADYINVKYDMNVKLGDSTYRILKELHEKIKARAMPSLPTE